MKKVLLIIMIMISIFSLSACETFEGILNTDAPTGANPTAAATEQTSTEKQESEGTNTEGETTDSSTVSSQYNFVYTGEYLDYEYNEPELRIYDNGNGTYYVYIGIIRLTTLEDVDAIATDAGLEFTAEDDAGNPIKGVITLEGHDAVVTFTESTWSLIPSGTVYRYYRPEG